MPWGAGVRALASARAERKRRCAHPLVLGFVQDKGCRSGVAGARSEWRAVARGTVLALLVAAHLGERACLGAFGRPAHTDKLAGADAVERVDDDAVVPRTAVDAVAEGASSGDEVVAPAAQDAVGPGATVKHVVAGRPVEQVVAAAAA